jgi:hypothetical protein
MMADSIGLDDGLFTPRIAPMCARDDARRFGELFAALFHRFHRHDSVDGWQPSPESLALMEHLSRTGPLTVREAEGHFGRSQAATSVIGAGRSSCCPIQG